MTQDYPHHTSDTCALELITARMHDLRARTICGDEGRALRKALPVTIKALKDALEYLTKGT